MRFTRQITGNGVTHLIVLVLITLSNSLVAFNLGPQGKGAYSLLMLFGYLILLLSNLGLSQAAIYYLGKHTHEAGLVAGNLLSASLIIGVPFGLGLALVLALMQLVTGSPAPEYLSPWLALITPISLAGMFASHVLVGLHDFAKNNFLAILDSGLRLLLLILMLPFGLSLSGIVLSIVVSHTLYMIISWLWVIRRVGYLRLRPDWALLNWLVTFGLRFYLTGFLTQANLRLDQFLVATFLSLSQLGIYSAAVAVAELGTKPAMAISSILYPRTSACTPEQAAKLTAKVVKTGMLIVIATVFVIAILGSRLIQILFGSGFAEALQPLLWLLPGSVALSLMQMLSSYLAGIGKPQAGLWIGLVSLCVTVVLDIVLIPAFQVVGAAIAATGAYATGAALALWFYMRNSSQTLWKLLVPTHEDWSDWRTLVHNVLAYVRSRHLFKA